MSWKSAFHLALRQMWRQKRRTWITLVAVALMTAILTFMPSFQLGSYRMMWQADATLLSGYGQIQRQDYYQKNALKSRMVDVNPWLADFRKQGIFATPLSQGYAFVAAVDRTLGAEVLGVEPQSFAQVSRLPQRLSQGRFVQNPHEMVMGQDLARQLQLKLGDEVTLLATDVQGSLAVESYQLVGLLATGLKPLDRQILMVDLAAFAQLYALEATAAHKILLGSQWGFRWDDEQRQLGDSQGQPVFYYPWQQTSADVYQLILMDITTGFWVYVLLVAVVVLTLINTQWMVQRERRHEFGILLALGLQLSDLKRLVWLETLWVFILGGLLGLFLQMAFLLYTSQVGILFESAQEAFAQFGLEGAIYPYFHLSFALILPLLVLIVGMFIRLPLRVLGRLSVVEVLRPLS